MGIRAPGRLTWQAGTAALPFSLLLGFSERQERVSGHVTCCKSHEDLFSGRHKSGHCGLGNAELHTVLSLAGTELRDGDLPGPGVRPLFPIGIPMSALSVSPSSGGWCHQWGSFPTESSRILPMPRQRAPRADTSSPATTSLGCHFPSPLVCSWSAPLLFVPSLPCGSVGSLGSDPFQSGLSHGHLGLSHDPALELVSSGLRFGDIFISPVPVEVSAHGRVCPSHPTGHVPLQVERLGLLSLRLLLADMGWAVVRPGRPERAFQAGYVSARLSPGRLRCFWRVLVWRGPLPSPQRLYWIHQGSGNWGPLFSFCILYAYFYKRSLTTS